MYALQPKYVYIGRCFNCMYVCMLTLLGMSVGEERMLLLPDCFFVSESLSKMLQGKAGSPNLPASYDRSGLQLTVRLLSINGDAQI